MEQIHSASFVYNDLNLDNLLLDYGANIVDQDDNLFDNLNVNLVDMSFVTFYMDQKGQFHVGKKTLDIYRGSMFFSGLNQLKFQTTSRRDDLISLFYLLIYLFDEGELPGITNSDDDNLNLVFSNIKKLR